MRVSSSIGGKDEKLPTRGSLLRRLKNWGDQASWNDFVRTYSHFLRCIALKNGLTEAEADDVVQETMIAVAKKMPKFDYDPKAGSFKSWLALIAKRRIADQWRKKHYHVGEVCIAREERASTRQVARLASSDSSPLEKQWREEWSRSVLDVASANVKEKAGATEYQMFYLHVVKQLPVAEVSKRLGVKNAQVYFAKYKLGGMMKREIKRLERQLI
jgi:RNA polymerase sigma factor (sigma-70 family)